MARWTDLTSADRNVFNDMFFDITNTIQRAKVQHGTNKVNTLRAEGIMPLDRKEITAYLGSRNINNQWPDIDRFNGAMAKSSKPWNKKFFYVTSSANFKNVLAEAAEFTTHQVYTRTDQYPTYHDHKPTYVLFNSVRTMVDGVVTETPSKKIRESDGNPLFEITNIAEYASSAEERSHFYRMGGIMYYAAKRAQRRYPGLAVRFTYAVNMGISTGHKYAIPLIQIGEAGSLDNRWSEPGERQRRAERHNKRLRTRMKKIESIFNGR